MNPIFDGHNDALLSVHDLKGGGGRSFFEWGQTGHLDLPRASAGGLKGGIFAIFIPAPPGAPGSDPFSKIIRTPDGFEVPSIPPVDPHYAEKTTLEVIATLNALLKEGQGKLGLVRAYPDLEDFLARDVLAVLLHLEGAEAIHPNLDNLADFYEKGVRSIGLVWSRPNAFGNGVDYRFPSTPDTGDGLTAAGKELVRACNRQGIQVDLAHLNEKGFWDAARVSQAPLIVSHTAVHAISPGARNLLDSQIDEVGKTGGLIGLMFEPTEIRPDGRPDPDTPLSLLVRHIAYVAERIGPEHIALGGDFDGALMPDDLKDAADLPKLVSALEDAGFTRADLDKILYQNWLRVLKAALKD